MSKLTDAELLAIIEQEEANSLSSYTGKLAEQRRQALQYYYGEPYGNEVEGRSQVVTTEVKDAIEGIMPSLMAIFTTSDEIVRFEPQGPEDEQSARQATDYVNYIFSRLNNGFLALYCLFKDALLGKNGFLKVYWEDYEDNHKETYEDLTDDEFHLLLQQPDLELVQHTEEPDETQPPVPGMPPQMTHDAVFRRSKKYGKVCIDPVPPEEILISRECPNDLKKARFIEHRTLKTLSEIREMGYDVPDDIADYAPNAEFNMERYERNRFDDAWAFQPDRGNQDPSTRRLWYCEAYIYVDADKDGIAELRQICKVGRTVLANEEVDEIPIIGCTGIPMPHKFYGLSVHDLVGDLQLMASTITRQLFDNSYLANNGRYAVLDGMVNMDDMLTSRPGGIVRTKTMGAIQPLETPQLGASTVELLRYVHELKTNRVGATDFPNAVDPDAINAKATFVEAYKNAALERINLMARIFAETGVKDLFWKIMELVSKHQQKPQVVRLRNQWVQVDPREWKDKFDMTVSVGLGTGSQQTILQGAMGIMQIQQGMVTAGLGGQVVLPTNVYHAARLYARTVFPKDADLLFTDPKTMPPPQPRPDPKLLDVQLKAQKFQGTLKQRYDQMMMDYQLEQQQMGNQKEADRAKMIHDHVQNTMDRAMQMDELHHDSMHQHLDRQFQQSQATQQAQPPETRVVIDHSNTALSQLASALDKLAEKSSKKIKRKTTPIRDEKGHLVGAVTEEVPADEAQNVG